MLASGTTRHPTGMAPEMADPLTVAIAAAIASSVAGKLSTSVSAHAGHAIEAIAGKVRDRLRTEDPVDAEIVEAAIRGQKKPEPGPLARILEREFTADPAFHDEIKRLWLRVGPSAADDGVSNVFYGKADKVVQLRDVDGGLTIN